MNVEVIATTDGKHIGEVHVVPEINNKVMKGFGMIPESITTRGNTVTVVNANYLIKLKIIGD